MFIFYMNKGVYNYLYVFISLTNFLIMLMYVRFCQIKIYFSCLIHFHGWVPASTGNVSEEHRCMFNTLIILVKLAIINVDMPKLSDTYFIVLQFYDTFKTICFVPHFNLFPLINLVCNVNNTNIMCSI